MQTDWHARADAKLIALRSNKCGGAHGDQTERHIVSMTQAATNRAKVNALNFLRRQINDVFCAVENPNYTAKLACSCKNKFPPCNKKNGHCQLQRFGIMWDMTVNKLSAYPWHDFVHIVCNAVNCALGLPMSSPTDINVDASLPPAWVGQHGQAPLYARRFQSMYKSAAGHYYKVVYHEFYSDVRLNQTDKRLLLNVEHFTRLVGGRPLFAELVLIELRSLCTPDEVTAIGTQSLRPCVNEGCTVIVGCRLHCAACRRAFYCSQACQRKHWRVHRAECGKPEIVD